MSTEPQQPSAGPELADAARYAELAGLIEQMEQAAVEQESYGRNYEVLCYGSGHAKGYAQACRHFAAVARQYQHNGQSAGSAETTTEEPKA